MSEMKWTHGNWSSYDDRGSTGRLEIVAVGKTVARIFKTTGDEAEDLANAHLIAAAPELYEALGACLAQMRIWVSINGDMVGAIQEKIDAGEKALAKARGEVK